MVLDTRKSDFVACEHPRSLISASVIRYLKSIVSKLLPETMLGF